MNNFHHITVLREETIDPIFQRYLSEKNRGNTNEFLVMDGTFGGGGHSLHLIDRCQAESTASNKVTILGCDADINAINACSEKISPFKNGTYNIELHHSNFSSLNLILKKQRPGSKLNGLILDLGVSSPQIDVPERGFSFGTDGPLDMRMDQSTKTTAFDLLMKMSEQDLMNIFWKFGDEPKGRKLAMAIVKDRGHMAETFARTLSFAAYVKRVLAYPPGRTHPATRTFQALRIEVNAELANLEALLKSIPQMMGPCASVSIITFHSGEDRLVKSYFRTWEGNNHESESTSLGYEFPRGGVTSSEAEQKANPRSRSARLRHFLFTNEPKNRKKRYEN